MAAGDPLAKYWTYKKIIEDARIASKTVGDPLITDAVCLDLINIFVQKVASILNAGEDDFYSKTITAQAITGTANPYKVSLAALAPFIDKVKKVVVLKDTTTRLTAFPTKAHIAASLVSQATHTLSLFSVDEGDQIKLWQGATMGIDNADTAEVTYFRQPIVASVTTSSKPDLPDKRIPLVQKMLIDILKRYKSRGVAERASQDSIRADIMKIYQTYGLEQAEK